MLECLSLFPDYLGSESVLLFIINDYLSPPYVDGVKSLGYIQVDTFLLLRKITVISGQ
jgi:hypothetical protein